MSRVCCRARNDFFSTPSATARRLFYYVTRVGHYYYDARYNFSRQLRHRPSGEPQESLSDLRSLGYDVLRDRPALLRRARTDRTGGLPQTASLFYTKGDAEALWIHFDGANAAAFFEQILAFRGGRQVLTPPADLRIEQELAQIISGLRTGDMTELDRSQRIYRILCALLFPAQAGPDRKNDAIAQAVKYIGEHLFESLSVEKVADAVSLESVAFLAAVPQHDRSIFPARVHHAARIDEAKALLQSTSLSVKEIAFRVGYRSEVNFITAFTEKTGATPTQFRRSTL